MSALPIIRELSPKNTDEVTFPCEHCTSVLKWRKTFFRHMRINHPGVRLPSNLPIQPRDEVTCRMCNSKILRSEMKRHLRRIHYIPDCQPGHVLIGFESRDDGVNWFPLFAPKGGPVNVAEFGSQEEIEQNVEIAVADVVNNPDCEGGNDNQDRMEDFQMWEDLEINEKGIVTVVYNQYNKKLL